MGKIFYIFDNGWNIYGRIDIGFVEGRLNLFHIEFFVFFVFLW
jgi:hypothetical protein